MAPFAYLSVSSSLHEQSSVAQILAGLADDLRVAGGEPTSDAAVDAPFAIVVLTGGTEQQILRAAGARAPGEPVVVVAHPRHNSLPAALEAVARLHQDGRPARIGYLDGEAAAAGTLSAAATDIDVFRRLRTYKIGAIGAPSDWLVASSQPPEAVLASWGPTVVPIAIEEVLAGYRESASADATARLTSIVDGMVTADGFDPAAISAASLVHPVLTELVRRHRLDALTIRCFDLVKDFGTSGCLALAALNDAGIMAGCEGDVPSLIAMVWTNLLLSETPWMANPAQVRLDDDLLVLAHCTIAPSLTRGYRITSHFESGQGAALAGVLPPGPVTLVRLGGRELRQHWIAEGMAVPSDPQQGLCRTQLTVRLARHAIDEMLTNPLGNHVVVVRGHHRNRLLGWLSATRVPAS